LIVGDNLNLIGGKKEARRQTTTPAGGKKKLGKKKPNQFSFLFVTFPREMVLPFLIREDGFAKVAGIRKVESS